MAGGKTTPRQKMIGMMYLVLTALLALNVTKEVVNAFVTINDKMESNANVMEQKIADDYQTFELKKMALELKKANMERYYLWKGKADSLSEVTKDLVHYLLSESNEVIKQVEGKDWINEREKGGKNRITALNSLDQIAVKDNYDVPTQLLIGSDPMKPSNKGRQIRKEMHAFRDRVTGLMGTYKENRNKWFFNAPDDITLLSEALKTANPEDTAKIAHVYRSLTIPENKFVAEEGKEMPWVSATFYQVPVVAAAAIFTSLKVDVRNTEALAAEYMLAKIEETPYYVNKIEPMVLAKSAYINQGDSLGLNVVIAAYDSTETYPIRWGMDADTLPEKWKEQGGKINLTNAAPGVHRVKGAIGVKERGELVWKNWDFNFQVGEPIGVISQPTMRLLYRGYQNEIEAAASGYPQDKIKLSASGGCTVVKRNGKWIVQVSRGTRNATLKVNAQQPNGEWITVASNEFEVRPLPKPGIYLGGISSGQTPGCSNIRSQPRITLRYDQSVPLTGVNFTILGGIVEVDGVMRKGKVQSNGMLDDDAKAILRMACGKKVTITCRYRDPAGEEKKANPFVVMVR